MLMELLRQWLLEIMVAVAVAVAIKIEAVVLDSLEL